MFWNRSYKKVEARIEQLEKDVAKVRLDLNEMDTHITLFAEKVKKMRKLAMEAMAPEEVEHNSVLDAQELQRRMLFGDRPQD